MTITRDGTPVAVVSPLPSPRLSAAALLERWRNLPVIDGDQLRGDLAELSVGPVTAKDSTARQQRQLVLQETENSFDPLPFDAACARRLAIVAAGLRESGKKSQARALDSLFAATALAHDLPLYTRNPRDFEGISDLDVRQV